MRLKDLFVLSYRALLERKSGFLLTVIMIIVGTSLVVTIDGLTQGFSHLLKDKVEGMYSSSTSPAISRESLIKIKSILIVEKEECNAKTLGFKDTKGEAIAKTNESLYTYNIKEYDEDSKNNNGLCILFKDNNDRPLFIEIDKSIINSLNESEPLLYMIPIEKYLFYFGYADSDRIINTVNDLENGFKTFISSIAFISLAVASIGIAITLLTSISERRREIGIMRSLGATRNTIIAIFLFEATITGIIGASIGIVCGIVTGDIIIKIFKYYEYSLSTLSPKYSSYNLILFWSISVILCMISGIYPSLKASRMPPLSLKK